MMYRRKKSTRKNADLSLSFWIFTYAYPQRVFDLPRHVSYIAHTIEHQYEDPSPKTVGEHGEPLGRKRPVTRRRRVQSAARPFRVPVWTD